MYYIMKAIAFAIICFAYATGVPEAVASFCYECEMCYGYKMFITAMLLGIIIKVATQ